MVLFKSQTGILLLCFFSKICILNHISFYTYIKSVIQFCSEFEIYVKVPFIYRGLTPPVPFVEKTTLLPLRAFFKLLSKIC